MTMRPAKSRTRLMPRTSSRALIIGVAAKRLSSAMRNSRTTNPGTKITGHRDRRTERDRQVSAQFLLHLFAVFVGKAFKMAARTTAAAIERLTTARVILRKLVMAPA